MKSTYKKGIKVLTGSSQEEVKTKSDFFKHFNNSPIPESEILSNLGLYLSRQTLSRILFMNDLYKKIINVHGVVMEFGVRWGQNMALYQALRGIYEPYNYNRKIIGFDTFEGFPDVDKKDGAKVKKGDYAVTKTYEAYLEKNLSFHELESPIAHKKKFELVKGDATVKIKEYLKNHPETIIAFAYFDFDIYHPTKICLEAIKSHLTKGSIVAFDELNCSEFPGETLAVKEVLGLDKIRLQRCPFNPLCSYYIVE